MRIGLACDHGGLVLKPRIVRLLKERGDAIVDFGPYALDPADDFPDFVIPMARAVASGEVERGVTICGSGVGACVAANKVPGVRAALIHDSFSARQGVEDDDMNVIAIGGRVIGEELAAVFVNAFLDARYTRAERFQRRLAKIAAIESREPAR
jgi:ribose 5-phosphate isomerase B